MFTSECRSSVIIDDHSLKENPHELVQIRK